MRGRDVGSPFLFIFTTFGAVGSDVKWSQVNSPDWALIVKPFFTDLYDFDSLYPFVCIHTNIYVGAHCLLSRIRVDALLPNQLYSEEKESPIPPDLLLLSVQLKAIVDYTSKFNVSGKSGRKNLTINSLPGEVNESK